MTVHKLFSTGAGSRSVAHYRFPAQVQGPAGLVTDAQGAVETVIDEACRALHLPTIRTRWEELAATAMKERSRYKNFLADLPEAEGAHREERKKLRLVREADFPRSKRLEDFGFEKNPNVTPEQVNTLGDPAWVTAGQPLCPIGDSGTGKSHLLIGIGTAIAEAGLKVRYTTTANLVNDLERPVRVLREHGAD
ncbi:ATP-binding protein [Streptomyces sp. NPDC002602]|uniref:ATP-binding protein n=1 Tax=Streptomyces sp. NPDC002602 TaxID=3364654 RepID=UPI0036A73411